MREAAEAVVRDSLGVRAGERVLVVAHTLDSVIVAPTLRIGATPLIEDGRFLL
jgi:hypothetical protein